MPHLYGAVAGEQKRMSQVGQTLSTGCVFLTSKRGGRVIIGIDGWMYYFAKYLGYVGKVGNRFYSN